MIYRVLEKFLRLNIVLGISLFNLMLKLFLYETLLEFFLTFYYSCRFDLIYLILDKADEQTDRRLAKHIVSLHFENPEVLFFLRFSD